MRSNSAAPNEGYSIKDIPVNFGGAPPEEGRRNHSHRLGPSPKSIGNTTGHTGAPCVSCWSTPSPLIGTWRIFQILQNRDEEGHWAYRVRRRVNRGASGLEMPVTGACGSLAALIAPISGLNDWLGAATAEIDQAARAYFAYCGAYEVRGNEVIHRYRGEPDAQLDRVSNSGSGRWTETQTRRDAHRFDSTVARKSRPSCGSGYRPETPETT